jgi:hypothetical protein
MSTKKQKAISDKTVKIQKDALSDNEKELFHETPIMKLSEADKIYSQIYVITCTETNKQYVGQANSHRKNNDKYRFHGYIGRFNDHISEALANTRITGGSRYLNNVIRKYGKENFEVELITNCIIDEADMLERKYVAEYDTLAPNGYNLTPGGKTTAGWVSLIETFDDEGKKIPNKRGRDFGFKHKKETIQKMQNYYKTVTEDDAKKKKETMRSSITEYNKKNRAKLLSNIDIIYEDDFEKYIRPVKRNDEIVDYVIRIKRQKRAKISNKNIPLDERYKMLYDALAEAYKIQQERLDDSSSSDEKEDKDISADETDNSDSDNN